MFKIPDIGLWANRSAKGSSSGQDPHQRGEKFVIYDLATNSYRNWFLHC